MLGGQFMVEFLLLGTVNLTSEDGREARSLIGQPRRLALLAYLAAATPRGIQRRDRLLTLFWPELDQGRARAALRQALHVLREELGPEECRSEEHTSELQSRPHLVCRLLLEKT